MNIFAIEGDPATNSIDWIKSAQSQDNYRVVKMILESCQMLCTTINILSDAHVAPYKSTHKSHPSTKWVRASSANFEALVEHTMAMIDEYHVRFGKIHKCTSVLDKCLKLIVLSNPIAGFMLANHACGILQTKYQVGLQNIAETRSIKLYEIVVITVITAYICYNGYMLWRGAHPDKFEDK